MEKNVHPNVKGRVVPANNEAEQAILGCVLIDEYAPIEIMSELKPEDFYSRAHQIIFEAMKNVYAANRPIDIITLVEELEHLGGMEAVGGLSYISSLTDVVPSAANYKVYLQIVKETKLRRKVIDAANKITNVAYAGDDDAMSFAEKEIFNLGEDSTRATLAPLSGGVNEAIETMERIERDPLSFKGIPTGFRSLDNVLNGFQSGDLVVIAARPGQGKTSIGMNFIEAAAFAEKTGPTGNKIPVRAAVFSLEMPAVQLARRMLCAIAKVDMTKANAGTMSDAEWKRIMLAKAKLDKACIYVDDSARTSPSELINKCRKLKREKGLDIIMIDYLQLMASDKRVENRNQEISDITRNLKIAAKELNVPILLLSQLSRKVDDRKDKMPIMSDLRESGAIEQDADIVMFIHRPYADNDMSVSEDERNAVQLNVAKHRNGRTAIVDLRWRGEFVSFEDADKQHRPEPKKEQVKAESDDEESIEMKLTKEKILSISPDDNTNLF